MASESFIDVSMEGYDSVLREFQSMHDSITPRWLKNTQRRQAGSIVNDMKRRSHSKSIESVIGTTTSRKRAGPLGIKIGVVKNDPQQFPDISAPALASVIEYGTKERYRQLKAAGMITGRVSTGSMPSYPFLRPAWDAGVTQFMNDMEEAVNKKVMKETR